MSGPPTMASVAYGIGKSHARMLWRAGRDHVTYCEVRMLRCAREWTTKIDRRAYMAGVVAFSFGVNLWSYE